MLADHLSAHPEGPGYATVSYYSGVQTRPERDHFDAWRLTRRVETGRLIHTDYDFERPSSDLTTEHADPRGHLFDHYTRFHYPGDYPSTPATAASTPPIPSNGCSANRKPSTCGPRARRRPGR